MRLLARWSIHSLLLLFVLGLPGVAAAQLASRIADLSHTDEPDPLFPQDLIPINDRLVFRGRIGDTGLELWATDGTSEGTEMLADSCPGCLDVSPRYLGKTSHLVFFGIPGNTREASSSLWRTDGTRTGTFEILGEGANLEIQGFDFLPVMPALGDRLFFVVRRPGGNGRAEPWVSDGTVAGTHGLWGNPSDQGFSISPFAPFTQVGDRVFFFADDASQETFLWSTDGTPAGTRAIRQIRPFSIHAAAAAGRFVFTALSGGYHQLWVSDGTAGNTFPLTHFTAEPHLDWLKVVGQQVYFPANTPGKGLEVWESDGSSAGTRTVTDFHAPQPFNGSRQNLEPDQVTVAGGKIFVVATDGEDNPGLYVSNGNPGSTRRLVDVDFCPDGPCYNVFPGSLLIPLGDRVMTLLAEPSGAQQMWSFDGTPNGGILLADRAQGEYSRTWGTFAERPGVAYFLALDRNDRSGIYLTDGSREGTRQVARFPHALDDYDLRAFSSWVAPLGNRFILAVEDNLWATAPGRTEAQPIESSWRRDNRGYDFRPRVFHDRLVWRPTLDYSYWSSGGTAETTAPLALINDSCSPGLAYAVAATPSDLYYDCSDAEAAGLWRTDDTPEGTLRLFPRPDASGNEVSLEFAAGEHLLYFTARHDDFILWRTDGTLEGTIGLIPDLPGRDRYVVSSLHLDGDQLYFLGAIEDETLQLWTSDGTPGGTRPLTDLPLGFLTSDESRWAASGGRLYFTTAGENFGQLDLWRTDGTAAGTERILGCATTGDFCHIEGLYTVGDQLLFFAQHDSGIDFDLWRTDGTAAGSALLRSGLGVDIDTPVVLGDRLYFTAGEAGLDQELWASDGTAAGTARVKDILPGLRSSHPRELTAAGGRLFFVARSLTQGEELWVSDGSAAGTRLVHDISPGPRSSHPQVLVATGSRLFFLADDGATGLEMWSLDLDEEAGVCHPGPRSLCLEDDRFRADITWRDFQDRQGSGTAVPLTPDTGYFWFFDPANVETIVKVLDGRGLNGHFWTFYGALSNVEYTLTMTDAQSGLTQRYFNPAHQFASVGDTESFGPHGASFERFTPASERVRAGVAPAICAFAHRAAAGSCAPSSTRLCLDGGRFAVEATWRDFQNRTGVGQAVPLTSDTGYFWFFSDSNVEVVTKVLDGTAVNGHFWTFYGALSNVEYTLRVTDTLTGAVKTYTNPLRRFGSVGDTTAF